MRKISATYIIPGNCPPLKNGILVCKDDGTVLEIIDTGGNLREQAGLEHYSGILVPGFVNAHCHLELSFLKGKIPEKKGLGGFLGDINNLRNKDELFDEKATEKADIQMQHAGIVAVGDVSNSVTSLKVKHNSRLFYHTFCEAFGFHPSRAEKAFNLAEIVESVFHQEGLSASVTPHSFYSVSEALFIRIKEKVEATGSILSLHNQESQAEEMFFQSCSGPLFDHMQQTLKLDVSHWKPRKENVLKLMLPLIPKKNPLLLIHNTYTRAEDVSAIKAFRDTENTFFVLCPNSNLYIENRMPPVQLLKKEQLNICLGTDSLASTHQLSILQEMITLQEHVKGLTLEELITWACLNGARALQIDDRFGSFERGKKPGIILITGADLKHLKLTSGSRVRVLQLPAS